MRSHPPTPTTSPPPGYKPDKLNELATLRVPGHASLATALREHELRLLFIVVFRAAEIVHTGRFLLSEFQVAIRAWFRMRAVPKTDSDHRAVRVRSPAGTRLWNIMVTRLLAVDKTTLAQRAVLSSRARADTREPIHAPVRLAN